MKIKIVTRLITAAVLVHLSACSSIKEAFPDKEKDYQFTTEIPKLIIPSDLAEGKPLSPSSTSTSSSASSASTPATTTEETETKPAATEEAESKPAENAADTPAADDQPEIDPKSITVELLESSNKIGYLRINTPFLRAWRMVSKGLSRQSIEVSDRNQADKIFTVQYDPDEKPIEDGSYSAEIDFMLHGFQNNEKEYQLKLVETDKQTDIVVLDSEQKPTADESGQKLLKVLQNSIKANLAGK